MENNEILSEENISKEIKKTVEKGFNITYDKNLDTIVEDLKKNSKKIIDNSLENFDIKNIKCDEFKKRFRNQFEIEFSNIMFETTRQFFESEEGEIKSKKVKVDQNEVQTEISTVLTLNDFWEKEINYNRFVSQIDYNILVHLILDIFFDTLKDYKKIQTYMKSWIKLSPTDENYNISLVTSKLLFELSDLFFSIKLPYDKVEKFNLHFDDMVLRRLQGYGFKEHIEKNSAYINLTRILRVVTTHIIRGGSLKFKENKDFLKEYPFLEPLFIIT